MRIKSVGTDFMGLCPAAVQIDGSGNPTLLVNSLTFDTAPHFAQNVLFPVDPAGIVVTASPVQVEFVYHP